MAIRQYPSRRRCPIPRQPPGDAYSRRSARCCARAGLLPCGAGVRRQRRLLRQELRDHRGHHVAGRAGRGVGDVGAVPDSRAGFVVIVGPPRRVGIRRGPTPGTTSRTWSSYGGSSTSTSTCPTFRCRAGRVLRDPAHVVRRACSRFGDAGGVAAGRPDGLGADRGSRPNSQ